MCIRDSIYWFLISVLSIVGIDILNNIFSKEPIIPRKVALQVSGDNRKELEKSLYYYKKNPSDSLKYKAACFLIENMPFYTYSSGEQLENYKSYYAWLKVRKGKTPQQVSDSVKKVFGPMKEPKKKRDIMEIDVYKRQRM